MDLDELAAHGLEPTPKALMPLIVAELERSGGLTRSELIKFLDSKWASVGGKPTEGRTTSRVKKALSTLQEMGVVENAAHGFYRLVDLDAASARQPVEDAISDPESQSEVDADFEDLVESVKVDSTVGRGEQFVYAFYLPTYRRNAAAGGASTWPMKIGMTTTSVEQRIASHRTALPEEPRVAVVIRTDNAGILERVIQGVLTARGRKLDTGGSEWFETSDDEILAIYRFVAEESVDMESNSGAADR